MFEHDSAWDDPAGFHDLLYHWMQRAPWLAISACAHLLFYFVLASIPWRLLVDEDPPVWNAGLEPEVVEEFLEPEEDEPEELLELPDDEPVLQDELADLEPAPEDAPDADAPTDLLSDALTDTTALAPLGLGGGPVGGKLGSRGHGRPRGQGAASARAVEDGLAWLAAHRTAEGAWSGADFAASCGAIGAGTCDGAGAPVHDVGLTGLALLAFLGDGHTTQEGGYRDLVGRGVRWLLDQQEETGLLGDATTHDYLYSHALATLALCEAYYFSRSPLLRGPAQRAVDFVQRARNPYGAWRYAAPPDGTNDTSITGWMVLALTSAREAGLRTDPAALEGALSWIDEVTDPESGRVGYDGRGTLSARTHVNGHFPDREALTAVGLLCRLFLGQTPADEQVIDLHAERLLRALPEWDPEGSTCDMYAWYYGTYALFQLGGPRWKRWERSMKAAFVHSQRADGDARGSWDPVGPWGRVGGRIYSTALMTLSLEVYYRYGRVLGAR